MKNQDNKIYDAVKDKFKDKRWRMESLYKIRTKDKKVIILKFNPIQQEYWQEQTGSDLILKARQHGITTLKLIDYLDDTAFVPNTTSAIIAHKKSSVEKIFRIAKFAYQEMPEWCKPVAKYDNKNELAFPGINSNIYIDTEIRGDTVHNLHFSEVAFIKDLENKMVASLETVPAGGRISAETTANGVGGYFYDLYNEAERGDNEWKAHFFGWHLNPEYQIATQESIELAPDEEKLVKEYKLSIAQILWRRAKIKRLKKKFAQEYPINSYEAFISTGNNRFNIERLREMERAIKPPISQTEFITIWENSKSGAVYVAGSDVAEGKQTGDYSVTDIYDYSTCEQVAQLRCKIDPEEFAKKSLGLVKMYNSAYWGIEKQNHGHTVLTVVRKEYNNLHYRTKTDDKKPDKKTKEMGWSTDGKSKPVMIDELDTAILNGDIKINSKVTLSELITYIEDEAGATNAQEGCNDDTVISTAIAWQMRKFYKKKTFIAEF